jgi:hypothetical protein
MGGYDNQTSKKVSNAKQKSIRYHYDRNQSLYEEYKSSKYQYLMSFVNYKKMVNKKKKST